MEDSAGQPHQVAGSYGITGQADYDGGVQLVVFVQLFVQGFIFGIIFVTDGDIQLVGPGLLSFPLVEGDFRSFALFAQVFPDKAVKHGPPVQDVDADFAHDAFYHPAGGEVIGFVYVARNVGILCQQLLVGIIHPAEYDGNLPDIRVSASHDRVGCLIIEHGNQIPSP